jgi:hypothetical protein
MIKILILFLAMGYYGTICYKNTFVLLGLFLNFFLPSSYVFFNPYRLESIYEFDNLRKTIKKYYLEEYFEFDVQMKVVDLEF